MTIDDHDGPSRGAGFDDDLGANQDGLEAQQLPVTGNRQGRAPSSRSTMLLLLHLLAPIAVAVLLWRNEQVEERHKTIVADPDAELLRLFNPANGSEQLRGRILKSLKVASPYVAVTVRWGEVQAIPISSPWAVRCDDIDGISIAFSPSTDTSGGLVVPLSEARPNKEQCLEIALSVAKLLDAILRSAE